MSGYAWFNGIAYLCMIIVVLEIGLLLTAPLLGLGLGGLWGRRWAGRRLAGPLARLRPLPRRLFTLIDRACNAAARPSSRRPASGVAARPSSRRPASGAD